MGRIEETDSPMTLEERRTDIESHQESTESQEGLESTSAEVNRMVKQFAEMKKMMKTLAKAAREINSRLPF